MNKKVCLLVTAVLLVLCFTGCGLRQRLAANRAAEESSAENDGTVIKDEHVHEWMDATCTEPIKCKTCGETEGEPLGHKWVEATYQQPKTCSVCGITEGEPREAKLKDIEFVELDKEYDLTENLTDANGASLNASNIAKVTFTNYKVFDSDDTHEAKEGYEWRTVESHTAIGDDTQYTGWWHATGMGYGEYYQDNSEREDGSIAINYNGEEYLIYPHYERVETKEFVTIPEFAEKYGWSGDGASYYVDRYEFQVPKGFDGGVCFVLDINEYNAKNHNLNEMEHIIYYRLK